MEMDGDKRSEVTEITGRENDPWNLVGFGLTHTGRKRSRNEDSIFLSDQLGLYLVADGMGGHAHGEVASALALDTISQSLVTSPRSLIDAVNKANDRVFQASREMIEAQSKVGTPKTGMGTTVVVLYIEGDVARIAHVGDSRAYRMRGRHLEILTQDHSLAEMARRESNSPHLKIRTGFKNVLIRAIGSEPEVEVDLREEQIQRDDTFLLCSDGLTNMVPEERIQEILFSDLTPQGMCQGLVDQANENGGLDNISCVIVRCA